MRRLQEASVLACLAWTAAARAQTTQAIVRGRVTDSFTGLGISAVRLTLDAARGSIRTENAVSDRSGYYSLPLVSPGSYVLRAAAGSYQPREVHGVALAVAALVEVDLVLRPMADVWEQGEYRGLLPVGDRGLAPLFGPDIDRGRTALVRFPSVAQAGQDAALSSVITRDFLLQLPLAGRDAYSLLVMMPGVTADAGTARGLGVAVNGQRPSASNFMLDGVEHNNYVVSAPLGGLAPEAIEEYRLSSNNFSAEFGRSSGVLANAVTRAGTGRWHGLGYAYGQNEILNANGFQQNLRGFRRAPQRQIQPGGWLGGPLGGGFLVSGSLERLRTRTRLDPVELILPTTLALSQFAGSAGRRLFDRFPLAFPKSDVEFRVPVTFEPPSSLDRWLGVARADRDFAGGRARVFTRLVYNDLSRPDFLWSPYPGFTAPLTQRTASPVVSLTHSPRANWTGEYRVAFSSDRLSWDRPHPEIPTYISGDGTELPGSTALYSYRNAASHVELNTAQTHISSRHALKGGGGLLERRTGGELTAGRDGRYSFLGVSDFLTDWPDFVEAIVARGSASLAAPSFDQRYSQHQWHAFLQDAWRWSPQALVSIGARYESFGAPSSQRGGVLYRPDRNDFAARAAISWRPRARGQTLAKAAYGVFYDRPFDNLWQNVRSNSIQLALGSIGTPGFPIADPLRSVLARLPRERVTLQAFPEPLSISPTLRDAYVHSAFAGVSHRLGEDAEVEVTGMAAGGRQLVTTDKIDRNSATQAYRANQSSSTYFGGSATYRHRSPHLSMQASYTWSHSIDLQSEALAGDFFDLAFTRGATAESRLGVSAFSREGDPRGDRGSSDFDQRHNATLFALWEPPVLRGWRIGSMAAVRSGFPYTVFAIPHDEGEKFYNLRANYGNCPPGPAAPAPVEGVRRLTPDDFCAPRPGRQGNTGRNGFAGPGFFNVDASLERSFRLPHAPETHRLLLRVESFNLLNHANLATPDNLAGSERFGVAQRGRAGRTSSFPALVPFAESGRQMQLLLRYEF